MGLDSFWHPPEDTDVIPPSFNPELKLCGGMFSAHGQGSFRGKVYNDLIERVTGVSLYQEVIDNDTVRAMADKLASLPVASVPGSIYKQATSWDTSPEEIKDLQRMFKGYADAGYTLKGWW